MRSSKRWLEVRISFVFVILFLFFLLILSRLIFFQVVEAKTLEGKALTQRLKKVDLPPKRGDILDRNGEKLAVSVEVEDVNATPYLIKNPRQVAKKLALILDVSETELNKKLTADSGFVYLAKRVDKRITEKIKALHIEGIDFIPNHRRFYPANELASQLVGFVGGENCGLEGLELYYDEILRGKPGFFEVEKDPVGRPVPGGLKKGQEPEAGQSLILTIDEPIQYQVEEALKKCLKRVKAKSATAIVMDPTNGDILAMASLPSFDPNEFTSSTPEARRNRALTDIYEPGSTMKVLVAAGCLEEKIYTPKSVLHLPTYLKIGNYRIGEAHYRPAGDYTLEQIIVKSYNIGAALLSRSLGKEKVYNYFKGFGFGQRTDIGFPGEQGGQLPPLESWSATTIYTVAYGQGVSATPLQVLMMFATIANDGLKVKPRLVKQVVDEEKNVVKEMPVDSGQKVISSRTAQELRYLLEKVVREGTGQMAAIPGYRVAGKTGTAKKPKIGGKGYTSGKYVASFAGFLPAREPRVAIIVVVDEPQGPVYGGSVAGPVFKEIGEFCTRYLRIIPEGAN